MATRWAFLLLLVLGACEKETPPPAAQSPSGPSPRAARLAGDILRFSVPAGWIQEDPSNAMRLAQYRIPDKAKSAKDAECVLFHFGSSNEMLKENIDRWAGQMGQSSPKTQTLSGACKVTLVDLEGTYTGDQAAGSLENARMLVAVVEASDGPWYFKLVGPAATVAGWHQEFVALVQGATK